MATTARARYRFIVKETGTGTPFLVLEPSSSAGDIPALSRVLLSLDLKAGTTIDQAQEIASYLDGVVDTLAYTDLDES